MMRVSWLCTQVVKVLFLAQCTMCGIVHIQHGLGFLQYPYTHRRLLGDGGQSSLAGTVPEQDSNAGRAPRRPAGIPHMWSERQHKERVHPHHQQPQHHPLPLAPTPHRFDHHLSGSIEDSTGETHDHVQEGASHSGKPQVTHQKQQVRKQKLNGGKLHRTGGINNILKRPGMDPELTGDASLSVRSQLQLADMNITQLIAVDHDLNGQNSNLTARQLRLKLRSRLAVTNIHTQLKHGRSRYSLVTTRVRTRAKRSDTDLGDDYTWAVIIGGSSLAILIVILCACVCARYNVDNKHAEALTPLPNDAPPMPAVFFVGGSHVGSASGPSGSNNICAHEPGVENSGFALGDLPCGGTEAGEYRHHGRCHMVGRDTAGPSTSTFGYSALNDDEDCVSLRSTNMDLEKS